MSMDEEVLSFEEEDLIEYTDDDDYEDEEDYVDEEEMLEVEDDYVEDDIYANSFISDTGDVVVMDNSDDEDGFRFEYVDIEKIAIMKRIRQSKNVDGLARSIKSTGLLEPIIVGPTATTGYYVLIEGFRRLLACAKAGKKRIPCVINDKISTTELPILEAMYNQSHAYTIEEQVDYIRYLEKEKGIMSASMIEFLLQMNSGDYTKLKDILNDNDEDIVDKLYLGIYNIEQAFKKLEQRRKRETLEERENKKAAIVYGNEEASGINAIAGYGEGGTGDAFKLDWDATKLDDGLEEASLNDMVEEGNKLKAFKPHVQTTGKREYIDPIIKKSVMARDNFTCVCCKRGGESFVDILDYHHILPVFLGGEDTADNGVMACVACHRLIHLYSTGDLVIPKEKSAEEISEMTEEEQVLYNDEQMRFKRIIKLGGVIRQAIEAKGISREQYKKENPNSGIGRIKPGEQQSRA